LNIETRRRERSRVQEIQMTELSDPIQKHPCDTLVEQESIGLDAKRMQFG
jgi:hypothetical protein